MHSDLNPKNLIVDPGSLAVAAVLDWEFAHAGRPYTDLGNAVRFDREPAWVDAVVAAYADRLDEDASVALDLARCADLWALVELAARREQNPVADRAHNLLRAIAERRDVHAWSVERGGGDRGSFRSGKRHSRTAARQNTPQMVRGPATRNRAIVVPPTGFEPALPP